MKIAVCTTFPYDYWNICAAEMLKTFDQNWPKDIPIYIQLDECDDNTDKQCQLAINEILPEDRAYFISSEFEQDQRDFLSRHSGEHNGSYLFDVKRFSYKVFALEKAADVLKSEGYDCVIWLDADVITKSPLSYDYLKSIIPNEDQTVSYLGRTENSDDKLFYSECGFVGYNLNNGGLELLKKMREYYVSDNVLTIKDGWTDCHVFDEARKELSTNDKNLSQGVKGTHVWPQTELGRCMEHRKGQRKISKAEKPNIGIPQQKQNKDSLLLDVNNLQIGTKNCVDHQLIVENIRQNVPKIRNWVSVSRRTEDPLVIVSAGPSLDVEEVRKWQQKGVKIIAVKHAMDRLLKAGIKPYACVLLDPRAHVENFVKKPDPDVVYFVASMVDPSVVDRLNENNCTVIGYHAFVNAGEKDVLLKSDVIVSGGSATATRSIGLFSDMFGYTDFHLYGYDLCHWRKPDMSELLEDGRQKYMEVDLGAHSDNNEYIKRTFWTEGQFLAQLNELQHLYKTRKDIKLNIYGDGMPAWAYRHYLLNEEYKRKYNEKIDNLREGTPNLEEFVNGCTRGRKLS